MKTFLTGTLAIVLFAILCSSCAPQALASPRTILESRLIGTWSVDKYEGNTTDGKTLSVAPFTKTNTGTFTFKDDHTGTYLLEGSAGAFAWSNTEDTITIDLNDGGVWAYTLTTNEETKQVWTGVTVDPAGNIWRQTVTLTKK
jgi:hypothetical protein